MATNDLFVEVFPIEQTCIPDLAAYRPGPVSHRVGSLLAERFNKAFPGRWLWVAPLLLTDTPVLPVQMDITLNVLREQHAEQLAHLEVIEEDPLWQLDAYTAAAWVIEINVAQLASQLREALSKMGIRLRNAYIMREHTIEPWSVDEYPSLSVSVRSHLLHDRNLHAVLQADGDNTIAGLHVKERMASGREGVVTGMSGTLGGLRAELNEAHTDEGWQRYLAQAPDDEPVIDVLSAGSKLRYPASLLRILVRTDIDDDFTRFQIDRARAAEALRASSETQALLVRTISDILKEDGIIDSAFNTRKAPALFGQMDFLPSLVFAEQRVRPYRAASLAEDFVQNGLHTRHERFATTPIRIAYINTLDEIATDFVEALSRQLERDFGMTVSVAKARNVRVVSDKNIASAVRAVQKEEPHVVLAFLPGEPKHDDPNYVYLKAQTLSKGIAAHAVYETTMHNPDAMARVLLNLLAKTGNTPYALAEPLEYADLVIGLDLVREQLARADRVVAMTRIYRNDGVFLQYLMDEVELDPNEPIPFVVLQKLLPEAVCEGKQIIIHHAGTLPLDMLDKLTRWAQVLNSEIHPIEIVQQRVPHLYALADGITNAPWGSIFRLNQREAFVAVDASGDDQPPQPLHVRVAGRLPIDQAVYSVLAWSLLYQDAESQKPMPLTILHAAEMAQWLARGILPIATATEGDVPFWL